MSDNPVGTSRNRFAAFYLAVGALAGSGADHIIVTAQLAEAEASYKAENVEPVIVLPVLVPVPDVVKAIIKAEASYSPEGP